MLDLDTTTADTGKVVNIGDPYFPPQKPGQPQQNIGRVIDVTLQTGEKTQTYTMPENLSVCYSGSMVFSTDKEGILNEVRAIRMQKQAVIDSVDKNREAVKACDVILEDWDTAYREKKENENRIRTLENKVDKLSEAISDFINEFKK